LELRNHLSADLIHVDLPRSEEHQLQLQVGQEVFARPRSSKVFLQKAKKPLNGGPVENDWVI
jgi:hypothetical protein